MVHKIFIAAPLSSYSAEEYVEKRNEMLDLVRILGINFKNSLVFYAGQQLTETTNFDNHIAALQTDIQAIEDANFFIFIYPRPILTSALVEVGYAMCRKIEIGIFVNERDHLPFLLKKSDIAYDNITIEQINNNLASKVISYLKKRINEE